MNGNETPRSMNLPNLFEENVKRLKKRKIFGETKNTNMHERNFIEIGK